MKDAKKATPAKATPAATFSGPTPARKDGKLGPDPAAIRDGKMNPKREGLVFAAIRAGRGASVAELTEATKLREPTVRYFGISAAEAGVLDSYRIGGEYYFVVKANDREASKAAKAKREAVIGLARDAERPKAKAEEKAEK